VPLNPAATMTPTLDTALSGSLTIQSAVDQHALVRDAMAAGTGAFDLSAVTECDTAGVQLLLAASQRARAQGVTLVLRHASEPVRDALRRYGLESLGQQP
jgi:anti-sigma B factor antagonist